MKPRVLLITPPMTQINTPYPATTYLTSFLISHGYETYQKDAGIELVHRLFAHPKVHEAHCVHIGQNPPTGRAREAIQFLLGRDPTLALQIASRGFLPEGPRFEAMDQLDAGAFGRLSLFDRAKMIASLYLDDIADAIKFQMDPHFEFSRYGEKLAASQASFDPLQKALDHAPTLVDQVLSEITLEWINEIQPTLVGLSVPFPGNMYGALRMAKAIKSFDPKIRTVLGGGYVNTELRSLQEPRVFDFIDFITLDDGERPLLSLCEYLDGKKSITELFRTFICHKDRVTFVSDLRQKDVPFMQKPPPTTVGLPLDAYIPMFEMPNSMNRLWTDFRWNKMTLAHGCYWKKCTFCDLSLDYISRYEALSADRVLEHMKALANETGQTGFHFVDEAAPPALLKALSKKIIEQGLSFTWWGNIRFEKSFTPELCQWMAQAGCVALSGGLEVASDRILKLINKGVTIDQVTKVTRAFSEAGIFVHAYLIYGFPTQTEKETIESLKVVRDLFKKGYIQSAYWHRFSATIHSPIGQNPKSFKIKIMNAKGSKKSKSFALNDLPFSHLTPIDHDRLGLGLKKAVYHYMLGQGFDEDIRSWF